MTTNIFSVQSTDVQRNLYPSNAGRRFSIGNTADDELSTADCDTIILIATDRLISMLPKQYRSRLDYVDGEYLEKRASGGETSYNLSLFPASNLKLYKNFYPVAQWSRKGADYLLDASEYSVNLTTGAIVLDTPMLDGETLIASYNHTAATKMLYLKDCVAKYAAIDIARAFNFFRNQEETERFELMEAAINRYLNGLNKDPDKGIPMIDELYLVEADTDEYNNDFWKNI